MVATPDMVGAGPRTGLIGWLSRTSVTIVLAIVGVLWLIPTFGLLVTSLRSASDNNATGWWTIFTNPDQLTAEPYVDILDTQGIVQSFFNTVLITVPSAVLLVLIAALAAYAFAFLDFRGRDTLFVIVVGLLVVPLQIALIPIARLFGTIGLFGTIPGVVLFHVAFGLPFAIFLLRNFFIGIPTELIEAAKMDGAGEWRVFSRVILPLGTPAIASLLIFQFLWVWNDLLVALIFAGIDA